MHALLGYLEEVGYTGAPRLVGDGLDDAGRQVLTFIEGRPVHPAPWTDDGIVQVARLLADLHAATVSFDRPHDAPWMPWYTHRQGPGVVIGHGDVGPWNVIARDGVPVAFVDCQLHGEMWYPSGSFQRRRSVRFS